eukprot:TRINITY_DN260_c0_g1_i3.p1 TRINITY_DN260_c0_g1~~TRINITY_DN260_c0_g1_i3.p1  ORF type:complete len:107 (-),score=7.43 TRINITY_DN260_c0_g1_i3:294-614(-)
MSPAGAVSRALASDRCLLALLLNSRSSVLDVVFPVAPIGSRSVRRRGSLATLSTWSRAADQVVFIIVGLRSFPPPLDVSRLVAALSCACAPSTAELTAELTQVRAS